MKGLIVKDAYCSSVILYIVFGCSLVLSILGFAPISVIYGVWNPYLIVGFNSLLYFLLVGYGIFGANSSHPRVIDERFVLSLPVSRKTVVSSKYAEALLGITVMVVPELIVFSVLSLVFGKFGISDVVKTFAVLLGICLIYASVILIMGLICGPRVIAVITAISNLIFVWGTTFSLDDKLAYLFSQLPVFMLISAALFALSWFISVKTYENKEF